MKRKKSRRTTAVSGSSEIGPERTRPWDVVGFDPDGLEVGEIDILAGVELVSFTATPDRIGPFGASRLEWEAKGPRGFGLRLNNVPVPRVGQQIVQPQSTTTYRLDAAAAGTTLFLRAISVQVDSSHCEVNSLFNPAVTIAGLVLSQVGQDGIYFRSDSEIGFSPGTIRLKLHLGKDVDYFPDPEIEIDASLGLTVSQGHVVSFAKNMKVDVSAPPYAWAIPGAVPGLAIAINMGADTARTKTERLIEGIGQLIDFGSPFKNRKLVKHSVRIGVDDEGHGTIAVTACPDALLVTLAEASSAGVLR